MVQSAGSIVARHGSVGVCGVVTVNRRTRRVSEEKGVLESYDRAEWRSVEDLATKKRRYHEYARNTFRKDARVNIRLSSKDLEAFRNRALERIQEAIMNGESPDNELENCLSEAREAVANPYLAFEEAEKVRTLLRRGRYLKELLERWQRRRKIGELETRLQETISPDAWEVFLDIEELLNRERLGPEGKGE